MEPFNIMSFDSCYKSNEIRAEPVNDEESKAITYVYSFSLTSEEVNPSRCACFTCACWSAIDPHKIMMNSFCYKDRNIRYQMIIDKHLTCPSCKQSLCHSNIREVNPPNTGIELVSWYHLHQT
jgi:hypothetical protein